MCDHQQHKQTCTELEHVLAFLVLPQEYWCMEMKKEDKTRHRDPTVADRERRWQEDWSRRKCEQGRTSHCVASCLGLGSAHPHTLTASATARAIWGAAMAPPANSGCEAPLKGTPASGACRAVSTACRQEDLLQCLCTKTQQHRVLDRQDEVGGMALSEPTTHSLQAR